MGDVWKLVVNIDRCLPQLDFRTIVGSGNPQTLVWRLRPGDVISEPEGDDQVAIAITSYEEFFRKWRSRPVQALHRGRSASSMLGRGHARGHPLSTVGAADLGARGAEAHGNCCGHTITLVRRTAGKGVGVKGVLLAGGTGSRLSPLTQITNKHLLPVYDRPMISYAVEALVKAGIEEIMVVTGGTHAGEFLRLLSNGDDFGVRRLNYAYQDKPGGIAQALAPRRAFRRG